MMNLTRSHAERVVFSALFMQFLLMMLLSLVMMVSMPASFAMAAVDETPPTAPGGLTGIRYSTTAGEILWSPATDDVFVVGYRVLRNGEDLGIKDARSQFEPELEPGQSYRYSVSAVDRAGNTGPELIVEISASVGTSNHSEPYIRTTDGPPAGSTSGMTHDIPGEATGSAGDGTGGGTGDGAGDGEGTETGNEASNGTADGTTDLSGNEGTSGAINDGGLVLYTSHGRITLIEGDATGISIQLSVNRAKQDKRVVTLSLESDAERDMLGIRHVFSMGTLAPEQSGSVLTMQLDVTAAPLMLHERFFQIIADDGESRTSTSLIVDVTPTSAPDVYLLIGQSNMEGYSEIGSREAFAGGKDERVERIRQLNVQPNSTGIFSSAELFTDELANVKSPPFVSAEDPLHEPRYIEVDGKGATFVGLGLTFAKEALRTTTADIYLVPAAWGATGFCANANGDMAWNANQTVEPSLGGTLLADRALTRLNMTLRETGGILRGILWHQGGADSNNVDCAETYADNLAKLADRLRTEARVDVRGSAARGVYSDIPFLVATQSKGDDERGQFSIFNPMKQKVDQAHRSVSDYITYSGVVNNDDLVPPQYPCGQVSCVHFGAEALREQGRRFHAILKGIWSEMGAYHY